jgi:hypothetical protein
VAPEFVETHKGPPNDPPAPATNFVPSNEQATDSQFVIGALLNVQLMPEFLEIKIPVPPPAAIAVLPSPETATQVRKLEEV